MQQWIILQKGTVTRIPDRRGKEPTLTNRIKQKIKAANPFRNGFQVDDEVWRLLLSPVFQFLEYLPPSWERLTEEELSVRLRFVNDPSRTSIYKGTYYLIDRCLVYRSQMAKQITNLSTILEPQMNLHLFPWMDLVSIAGFICHLKVACHSWSYT